ncbi:hypothetical protein AMTRI_Chr13g82710 [Amborella trichopoda]
MGQGIGDGLGDGRVEGKNQRPRLGMGERREESDSPHSPQLRYSPHSPTLGDGKGDRRVEGSDAREGQVEGRKQRPSSVGGRWGRAVEGTNQIHHAHHAHPESDSPHSPTLGEWRGRTATLGDGRVECGCKGEWRGRTATLGDGRVEGSDAGPCWGMGEEGSSGGVGHGDGRVKGGLRDQAQAARGWARGWASGVVLWRARTWGWACRGVEAKTKVRGGRTLGDGRVEGMNQIHHTHLMFVMTSLHHHTHPTQILMTSISAFCFYTFMIVTTPLHHSSYPTPPHSFDSDPDDFYW